MLLVPASDLLLEPFEPTEVVLKGLIDDFVIDLPVPVREEITKPDGLFDVLSRLTRDDFGALESFYLSFRRAARGQALR